MGESSCRPADRVFGGQIESAVHSRAAEADSVSLEPFNHLDLDISQPAVSSVRTALAAFCNAETVREGQATRRVRFRVLPNVLILSLKRFAFNRGKGGAQKIKKAIKYDEKLVFESGWLADGVQPEDYYLTAIICHHGDSSSRGHYTAIVRYNAEWYEYNDAAVRRLERAEVGSQHCTAYLVVYMRRTLVDLRP